MTRGLLSSMAALLTGTGLALAQAPAPMPPGPSTGAPTASQPSAPVADVGTVQPASPYGTSGAALPPFPNTVTPGGPAQVMTCAGGGCGTCGNGGCGWEGCPTGDCCQPCYHVWVNGEYLLWRFSNPYVPSFIYNQPLGTITLATQVVTATDPPVTTIINQEIPVLIASNVAAPNVNLKDLPGFRIGGGFWCDSEQCLGFDFNYWWLWRKSYQFANIPIASPTGLSNAVLIPTSFTDQFAVPGGTGEAQIIEVPINLLVNINAQTYGSYSTQIWGMEYNVRTRKCYFGCSTFDCLAGFRFMNVNEALDVTESLSLFGFREATVPGGGAPQQIPTQFVGSILDSIKTDNRFFGAQVGVTGDVCLGCGIFVSGWGKVALGDMREKISLAGGTFAQNDTGTVALPGGTLVGPGDAGTVRRFDRICCIPEVAVNFGYQPCCWLRTYVGYTCMYISSLARPGNLSNFTSTSATVTIGETTQSSNVLAPTFQMQDTSAFLQGINFGVELRW